MENYEQINYEKYEFFQLPQSMFEEIIMTHQSKKIEGLISGFPDSEIR